jgi:hypothetical protein
VIQPDLACQAIGANQGSPSARQTDNGFGFDREELAISPEICGSGGDAFLRERSGNSGVIVVDLKGSKAILASCLEAGGILLPAFAA